MARHLYGRRAVNVCIVRELAADCVLGVFNPQRSAIIMTTSGEPIYSNLAIPPGETIAENIEFLGIPVAQLATTLGLSEAATNEVIAGDRAITPDIAAGLEATLGISAQLWLNLEARYRTTVAKNWEKTGGKKEHWTDWCYGRVLRKIQFEDAGDRAAV